MDYRKKFLIKPGRKVTLDDFDPGFKDKHTFDDNARDEIEELRSELAAQQHLLYAEKKHALLIILQGMDAAGKDGTVQHVMSAMNPQGTIVTEFKQPTALELEHDFLWRVHPHAPAKGTVAVFNRSHYEEVLVVRIHHLAPQDETSVAFQEINDFEELLYRQNSTHIIKFFLHISKKEQLERFEQRIDDPARNWKISESDYRERELWDRYINAYEDVLEKTSTKHAPWYVIPSNHKWFRNLAVSRIMVDTMKDLDMRLPKPAVDLEAIRKEYHEAAKESEKSKKKCSSH